MSNKNERKRIMCANSMCNIYLSVLEIPKECPNCHQSFNRHAENETVTDVIYNLIVRRTDKGYIDCDPYGWTTGESLLMPDERRREIG